MKIIIERGCGRKVVIDGLDDDLDIHGVVEEIYALLIAYGFHPNSVKDGFLSKAEELEGDSEN